MKKLKKSTETKKWAVEPLMMTIMMVTIVIIKQKIKGKTVPVTGRRGP
jgi:hypothetical protein